MDDNIAIINNYPTTIRRTFNTPLPIVIYARLLYHPIRQGIQHAVTGGSADNEVIREGCDLFNIQQDDIFAFLFFKGIDDRVCKFQCIQNSPRKVL